MKRAFLIVALLGLGAGGLSAQDLDVCSEPALAIINLDTVTDDIDVADDITLGDLDVYLDITHSWIGDLVINVDSPGGTTVLLMDSSGG